MTQSNEVERLLLCVDLAPQNLDLPVHGLPALEEEFKLVPAARPFLFERRKVGRRLFLLARRLQFGVEAVEKVRSGLERACELAAVRLQGAQPVLVLSDNLLSPDQDLGIGEPAVTPRGFRGLERRRSLRRNGFGRGRGGLGEKGASHKQRRQ